MQKKEKFLFYYFVSLQFFYIFAYKFHNIFKKNHFLNTKTTIHQLISKETDNWIMQLFRYTIVGGIAFCVDYGLLYLLTEYIHFHYLMSATISFLAGLVVNYILTTWWIFKHHKLSNKTLEFIIYGIIGLVGLLFNNILMYCFTDILHLHYMLSKLITAILVMGWNFFGRKIILFKNNTSNDV